MKDDLNITSIEPLVPELASLAGCEVCCLTEADVPDLCFIESEINPSPWTEQNFLSSLRSHHICLGLKRQHICLAYLVCSVVMNEAELLILGVNPAWQRKGVAHFLMQKLINTLRPRVNSLFLEVRESNDPAIQFYDSLGFNSLGTRPAYYPAKPANSAVSGRREDALILALELENT